MPAIQDTWGTRQILFALLMVSTGSINTLAAKWADTFVAKGQKFDHPFLQAVCMFVGEFLCLPVYFLVVGVDAWRRRRQSLDTSADLGLTTETVSRPKFNPLIMLPAALCDMCATSIMYVGLNLTNAASFQMLRGSVIIFTGVLSVIALRARLQAFRIVGMLVVFGGLVVVGLADILFSDGKSADSPNEILGDALILASQIVVSIQMVYEQKYVVKYEIPALLAVGLEGLFGMVILSALLVPMYYIRVGGDFSHNPLGRLEDVGFALQQALEQPLIFAALGGTILSIAFFNFAGISVTKELSATTRMVLDSVRTVVIWVISLALAWQQFVWLQIIGFVLLISGMCLYNDLLIMPAVRRHVAPWLRRVGCARVACCGAVDDDEQAPIVPRSDDEGSTAPALT